jgi:hypothetical protein
MPFTYQIDAKRSLVTVEAEVVAHPEFRPEMKVLSDHRELETVVSVEFVRMFLGRVSQMKEALRQARWAFVERGLVRLRDGAHGLDPVRSAGNPAARIP